MSEETKLYLLSPLIVLAIMLIIPIAVLYNLVSFIEENL